MCATACLLGAKEGTEIPLDVAKIAGTVAAGPATDEVHEPNSRFATARGGGFVFLRAWSARSLIAAILPTDRLLVAECHRSFRNRLWTIPPRIHWSGSQAMHEASEFMAGSTWHWNEWRDVTFARGGAVVSEHSSFPSACLFFRPPDVERLCSSSERNSTRQRAASEGVWPGCMAGTSLRLHAVSTFARRREVRCSNGRLSKRRLLVVSWCWRRDLDRVGRGAVPLHYNPPQI